MKKILKLSGVSVLAIVATTAANAAGYTCENDIVYESCNGGYYLTDNGTLCPDGYEYTTGYCDYGGQYPAEAGVSEESCLDYDGAVYMAEACGIVEMNGEVVEVTEPNKAITKTCADCPSGSYCPAGSDAPTACPAGSYCAGTKLTAPSGQCAAGSYSTGGAIACTECPKSGLTDASGKAVPATTDGVGATSSSACYVAAGTTFENKKGTYKYTQKCAFGNFNERADCEAAAESGAVWYEGDDPDASYCMCDGGMAFWNYSIIDGIATCLDADYVSKSSHCEDEYNGTWSWDDLSCNCPNGQEWIEDSDDSGYCE